MKTRTFNLFRAVRRSEGMTLLEVLIVMGLLLLLLVPMGRLTSSMMKFITRSQVRHQANMQARVCVETIERMMSSGKASSLSISTPATGLSVPSSSIQFSASDGASIEIALSNDSSKTVHLRRTPLGSSVAVDTILATHVDLLEFNLDATSPEVVKVTLEMTVPLDSSGTPESLHTIFFPSRPLRMIAF